MIDGFSDWAKRHAAIFGFTWPTDGDLLREWGKTFEANGYTAPDLHDATTFIASDATIPRTRTQNLAAINAFMRSRRLARSRANQEAAARDGPAGCNWCQDTGRVIVPHPKCVADGQWHHPFYTLAVLCYCRSGERIAASIDRGNQGSARTIHYLRLRDYEDRNPSWERQLRDHASQQKLAADAHRASEEADKLAARAAFDAALAGATARNGHG